jgi:hypothetical protein
VAALEVGLANAVVAMHNEVNSSKRVMRGKAKNLLTGKSFLPGAREAHEERQRASYS